MNYENSKTSDPHILLPILTDNMDLRKKEIYCFIKCQHLLYMEKYKKPYKNNKFEPPAPTWNEEFELPDGSYSLSGIQVYFEYILKKHE